MKIAAGQIDRFLASPAPDVVVLLFYGPDRGLVRERADRMIKQTAGDDPFLYTSISPTMLKDEPTRLVDDALTLTLLGGRRVVHVRDAPDSLASPLKILLSMPDIPALVVVEADDLPPRSALRKLAEESNRAAAIACYGDDGVALSRLIAQQLSAAGLNATPEALTYLTTHLGGDRAVTRAEIAKLVTFKGEDRHPVTLDEARACVGDSAAQDLDALVFDLADGDIPRLCRNLQNRLDDGTPPIAILRALTRHFQRLLWTVDRAQTGTLDNAVAALRPPLFFKNRDRFLNQARQWPRARLLSVLRRLNDTEALCKTTGMPAAVICAQLCLELASLNHAKRNTTP